MVELASQRRFNTNIKVKATATLTLLFIIAIAIGACSRGEPTTTPTLPVLYEAPIFTLTNQDNSEVNLSDFRGKVVVLDFVYTRCPDVCGEMNFKLQSVWQQLEEELKPDLNFISVSFDLYDTPEVLKQYAKIFDVPGWQFLTGTEEQIRQVKDDYGVIAISAPDGWEIVHSMAIVLIDRDGMVRKTYGDLEFQEKDMIRELEYLLKQ
jgi:protein SCO1/2|tara:strand:- start:135 stop:758 length:624 start_codon:yes stop_codon:yes gene_type:complete